MHAWGALELSLWILLCLNFKAGPRCGLGVGVRVLRIQTTEVLETFIYTYTTEETEDADDCERLSPLHLSTLHLPPPALRILTKGFFISQSY